ncbi:glycosyltransferase family 4 protein [Calditerricola satsumensis]|uniref:Glycosyl transferase n=1 Tax=Calditerricola satsumensis TaxID=373054 RepID=A0A8J3F9H4_9BACI|nr:glycosyltransferase family 4 protein [Calditerricola satsumensis]GGJ92785.1 glycosyl transferase [Calditerricola satsumensis]
MAQQLRVLHVIGGGEYGGAEEYLVQLFTHLRAASYPVNLHLACFYEAQLSQELRERGFSLTVLPFGRLDVRLWRGLSALLARVRPHLVHTHGVKANFFTRLAARKTAIPLITTVHSMLRYDYPNPLAYFVAAQMERRTRRWNHHFIAISRTLRDHLVAEGVPPERISVIHHGIDVQRFSPDRTYPRLRKEWGIPADAFVWGTVARFVEVKGLSVLIEAFARVRQLEPRAHLVLIGDGPLRERLRKQVRTLGIADAVTFTGFRRDVPNCLANVDAYVSASFSEGLGLSVLEAMAMGLPVVCTAVGGILDFLRHGENGWLVPPRSDVALAEGMIAVMRDPVMRARFAQQAARDVRDAFSAERMARETFQVYEQLVQAQAFGKKSMSGRR